jgi:hypothetical protein
VKFTADDLRFQDDEETEFGSNGDYGISYSSGNDRLEINDKINSAISYVPRGRSGSLVKGRFGQTVAEGKVLADDGNIYDSVQAAVNNASSWVRIGEGRFNEGVTIDTAGLNVIGSGRKTIVHANSGPTIDITGSDVLVRGLKINSESDDGIEIHSDRGKVRTCRFETIGENAVDVRASDCIVNNSRFGNNIGNIALNFGAGNRVVFANNIVKNASNIGVYLSQHDALVAANYIEGSKNHGVRAHSTGNDSIILGNRIHDSSKDGIHIDADDCIVANNRISNSGGQNIDDDGSNTTLDGNLPPAP